MRIGIFSDAHLGPYGDRIDPETGLNARLIDYKSTLHRVVQGMVDEKVDLVIFGGDAFKNPKPSPTLLNIFSQEIADSVRQGLWWYMVTGNHDMPKAMGELSSLVPLTWRGRVFGMDHPKLDVLTLSDGKIKRSGLDAADDPFADQVQIIALPYPNRNLLLSQMGALTPEEANRTMHDIMATALRGFAAQLNPSIPSILVAHLSLDMAKAGSESSMMMGRDVCLGVADIPDEIDYAFFGHVHKPQYVSRANSPMIDGGPGDCAIVLGSIESVDFGEEGEKKRWMLLDTVTRDLRSIPTGCRKRQTFNLNATNPSDFAQIGSSALRPEPGAMVRAQLLLRHGQEFDTADLRRQFMEGGAYSVQIQRVYDEEVRIQGQEMDSEPSTYVDVLDDFCQAKNIGIADGRARLIDAALREIEEVSAE